MWIKLILDLGSIDLLNPTSPKSVPKGTIGKIREHDGTTGGAWVTLYYNGPHNTFVYKQEFEYVEETEEVLYVVAIEIMKK